MDLSKIKYYPDKFYLCLDNFDIESLSSLFTDCNFTLQQSVYIHEYYHYLTNLTTFQGLRQFNIHFQDRIRLLTILLSNFGISAFPIKDNKDSKSKDLIKYWKDVKKLIDSEDINYDLSQLTEESVSKSFSVSKISDISEEMEVVVNGETILGHRYLKNIHIDGVPSIPFFKLTIGVLDEFLSASIDEFLFENNMADNLDIIRNRPFFPYRLFDELLSFFGLYRMSNKSKIIVSYNALHSFNPVDCFINSLEYIKKIGLEVFEENPTDQLIKNNKGDEIDIYKSASLYLQKFADECFMQKRRNLGNLFYLLKSKADICTEMLEKDYFCFIRPFLVEDIDKESGRKDFLLLFKDIREKFEEPLILYNNKFINANDTAYNNHLAMLMAIYEILGSLESNQIAKRSEYYKNKYSLPVGNKNSDRLDSLTGAFPIVDTWHIALNELSLYGVYLSLQNTQQL